MKTFRVLSVNVSEKTGEPKRPVASVTLREGHGIEGDVHAGAWHRQVSLLANEDVDYMRSRGAQVGYGDFAENITTEGIELPTLPVGTRLRIGEAELEVTQIGKKCHSGCAIMQQIGECIMPRRGIFARVIKGGIVTNESTGAYDF